MIRTTSTVVVLRIIHTWYDYLIPHDFTRIYESCIYTATTAKKQYPRYFIWYASSSNSSYLSALNSYPQQDYADKLLYHQALNHAASYLVWTLTNNTRVVGTLLYFVAQPPWQRRRRSDKCYILYLVSCILYDIVWLCYTLTQYSCMYVIVWNPVSCVVHVQCRRKMWHLSTIFGHIHAGLLLMCRHACPREESESHTRPHPPPPWT